MEDRREHKVMVRAGKCAGVIKTPRYLWVGEIHKQIQYHCIQATDKIRFTLHLVYFG
jgi:hypothetical protein